MGIAAGAVCAALLVALALVAPGARMWAAALAGALVLAGVFAFRGRKSALSGARDDSWQALATRQQQALSVLAEIDRAVLSSASSDP